MEKKDKKRDKNTGQLQSKEELNNESNASVERPVKILEYEESERSDRFGNPITTDIGKFSLGGSKRMSKSQYEDTNTSLKSKTSNTSGGTGEPNASGKSDKKTRHKISFMDDVSNDKNKLTEIHLIESYKKFN